MQCRQGIGISYYQFVLAGTFGKQHLVLTALLSFTIQIKVVRFGS